MYKFAWIVVALLAGCSGGSSEPKGNNAVVVITNNGECPACADGEVCIDGFCQVEGCTPMCEGSACGPNGCGGMCNPCEGRAQCVDGSCELVASDCTGFAGTPTDWAIPAASFGDDVYDQLANPNDGCSLSAERAHLTLDLTGDGRPDFVLTDDCDDAGVGTDHWLVYENTGSGFAASATTWALPSVSFGEDAYDQVANSTGECSLSAERAHSVFDLTGDGKPDLVLTDDCDDAGVGTDHWKVYENTGSGFASTATTWAIPSASFGDDVYDQPANPNGDCSLSAERSHLVLDLTGDGRPDFVLTDDCDDAGVGTDHWMVYENTGDGFASTATTWAIPAVSFGEDAYDRVANPNGDCSVSAVRSHSVLDLTGDGRPDFVLTDDCDDAGIGTDTWKVYENTGSGFATESMMWNLPSVFGDDPFDQLADPVGECSISEERSHSLADMNGDGMPDLLLTDDCDEAGVGTDSWKVFENTGTGFANEAMSWSLPNLFGEDPLDQPADPVGECSLSEERSHQLLDINGDGLPELVLADNCDSAEVGTTHWSVYAPSCN